MGRTLLIVWAALLVAGCGPSGPLDPEERARAAETLYPQFHRIHGPVLEDESERADRLRSVLARLQPEDADRPVEVFVTAEADPDALCLPGDRLLVSRGLLAFVTREDEAAAALATALQMCPSADATWRDEKSAALPAEEVATLRMLRYIDIRLAANALLYRLAVADACRGGCRSAIREPLEQAGFDPLAFDALVARIAAASPEALWLDRIGAAGEPSTTAFPDAEEADWSGLGEQREGLVALAIVRREIGRGRVIDAYQSVLDARRLLNHDPHAKLIQAELELHNNHPFYTRDLLVELEREGHPIPDEAYLRGWMQTQLREYEEAKTLLAPAMEVFPRVAGLYQLAVLRTRDRDHDAADALLARARAAGPLSPYIDEIEWLEDAIEKRRARE